jgi:hypothetical protein
MGTSASKIDSLFEGLFAVMGVASEAEAIAAAHKRGLLSRAIDIHGPDRTMQCEARQDAGSCSKFPKR